MRPGATVGDDRSQRWQDVVQQETSARGTTRQRRPWASWASLRPALPPPRLTADVSETVDGDAFVVEISVPGLTPDESTSVSARPRQGGPEPGRTYLQREQPVGPMSRVFTFPVEIDTDNVRATIEHGMLRIDVPKATVGQRRVIKLGSKGSK
jgi:HSP20 family molecular chaperone IbpA